MTREEKVFNMPFYTLRHLYIQKVSRKDGVIEDIDSVILWLTGYTKEVYFETAIKQEVSVSKFFEAAPLINPKASQIKGSICGVKVQEIEDPLMQKIRWLDLLIDKLSKGKSVEELTFGDITTSQSI